MVVPSAAAASFDAAMTPPLTRSSVPLTWPRARVRSRKCETEAIEGSASPRNPSVTIAARSSARRILLVAWRSSASRASSGAIPSPSSSTRTCFLPPSSTWIAIRVAPASIAFSTSSLTTEAGRSTTSPAAIWLARSSGRRWTLAMARSPRGLDPAPRAREADRHGQEPVEAVAQRLHVVGDADEMIVDVAEPEGDVGADVDELAPGQALDDRALRRRVVPQVERLAAEGEHVADGRRRRLLEHLPFGVGRALDEPFDRRAVAVDERVRDPVEQRDR